MLPNPDQLQELMQAAKEGGQEEIEALIDSHADRVLVAHSAAMAGWAALTDGFIHHGWQLGNEILTRAAIEGGCAGGHFMNLNQAVRFLGEIKDSGKRWRLARAIDQFEYVPEGPEVPLDKNDLQDPRNRLKLLPLIPVYKHWIKFYPEFNVSIEGAALWRENFTALCWWFYRINTAPLTPDVIFLIACRYIAPSLDRENAERIQAAVAPICARAKETVLEQHRWQESKVTLWSRKMCLPSTRAKAQELRNADDLTSRTLALCQPRKILTKNSILPKSMQEMMKAHPIYQNLTALKMWIRHFIQYAEQAGYNPHHVLSDWRTILDCLETREEYARETADPAILARIITTDQWPGGFTLSGLLHNLPNPKFKENFLELFSEAQACLFQDGYHLVVMV